MKDEVNNYNTVIEEGIFATSDVWDAVSESYAIEINESEYALADEIYQLFQSIGIVPPAAIIELGCGSGHLSACLALKGYKVSLLDFAEGALKKAKETFEHYKLQGNFIKGDIFDLKKLENAYDLAWNSGVMEHFSGINLQKIYRSIMNVTRDKFVFLVPNPNSISYLMMRYNLQGRDQWPYGMEYLRTDYLEIAQKSGLQGGILGYAALSISKWHFLSTFSDSSNAGLFSAMVDDGLIPHKEAYLIAYSLSVAKENCIEAVSADDDGTKESIFELSAVNFSRGKGSKR